MLLVHQILQVNYLSICPVPVVFELSGKSAHWRFEIVLCWLDELSLGLEVVIVELTWKRLAVVDFNQVTRVIQVKLLILELNWFSSSVKLSINVWWFLICVRCILSLPAVLSHLALLDIVNRVALLVCLLVFHWIIFYLLHGFHDRLLTGEKLSLAADIVGLLLL